MNIKKKTRKYRPFIQGYCSIYDLAPSISNPYENENGQLQSTAQSIYGYWCAVGGYLQYAMSTFDEQQEKAQSSK